MSSTCVHANCPCPPVPGSRLCNYHRCQCGREKMSSNDQFCPSCASSGMGGRGRGGQMPSVPGSNVPSSAPGGGYARGGGAYPARPPPQISPMNCAREGCTLPKSSSSRFCMHHGCRCGKEKSSQDAVCISCGGGVRAANPPPAGGRPAGGGGEKLDKEEEAQKAAVAGLRIDEPKPGDPPFDLDRELGKVVGMRELKQNIQELGHQIKLDIRRGVDEKQPLHMVFTGNPGTGKTSMARIMARMLHAVGYSESPRLVEVQRADLVAEYVGQTAVKTKRVIKAAKGGVLFVDEAYRLCSSSGKDFGQEAIEELMSVMTDTDITIILAGYPAEMRDFIETNPGLFRRIRYTFSFPDYSPYELGEIFLKYTVEKRKFRVEPNCHADVIGQLMNQYTTPHQRARMNGGIVEHIFEGAKKALDRSISPTDSNPSIVLLRDHIIVGMRAVKEPPPPNRGPSKRLGGGGPDDPPVAYA